jgi:hypothetical protein
MKIKPTIRQEAAFKIMLEKLKKKEPAVLKKIMLAAGYSESSAVNPELNLTSKVGWEMLKRQLDGNAALQAFNDLVSASNEDKRNRLTAAIEIFKVISPDKQANVINLFEKVANDFNTSEEN